MLLWNFPVCRVKSLRDAEEELDRVAPGSVFSLPGRGSRFTFAVNKAQFGGLSLISASCDVPCNLDWTPAGYVRQAFQISKSSLLEFDGRQHRNRPETGGCFVPAASRLKIYSEAGYESLTMRIDDASLTGKLSALIGETAASPAFDLAPAPRENMRALRVSTLELARELSDASAFASNAVLQELAQSAIVKLLLYQKHNYSRKLLRVEPLPSRRQMQSIVDYIVEHWDEPLTVETLAEVSNVGARTILRMFAKEKGCSPTALIKRIRLEHSRAMLMSSEGKGSVLSVALKCGFHSFGHFAREYRIAFGELPSETLRRSKSK